MSRPEIQARATEIPSGDLDAEPATASPDPPTSPVTGARSLNVQELVFAIEIWSPKAALMSDRL